MATKESIAVMRDNAIGRLEHSASRIAESLDIKALAFPRHNRDQAYLQAQQLDVLAGFFERIADALTNPNSYNSMTKAELAELAKERGVDLKGLKTKVEIIDALQAADGITEAEQAAQDGADLSEAQPETPESEGEEGATAEETTSADEDEPPDDPAGE